MFKSRALKVHSIETMGTHDGPGIRFILFLQGCNFHCLYCHNPDTQEVRGGKAYTNKEIINMVKSQLPYFKKSGGFTVSGGEPLLQADALLKLFKQLKKIPVHIVLDTNGSVFNDRVRKLLDYVDLVLLDIKHANNDWHKKITGHINSIPLEFAQYLEKIGKPFWLRYVFVPGFTDQEEYLHQLGSHFKGFKHLERMEVLPYHTLGIHKYKAMGKKYHLEEVVAPSKDRLNIAGKTLESYFTKVRIR